MVIYTKTGDKGITNLANGQKVNKAAKVFEVLGTMDELNAFLGMLHTSKKADLRKIIMSIQSDLLYIGSFFAGRKFLKDDGQKLELRTAEIEKYIDKIEKLNKPLKNFILPGGKQESSYLHLSRAISRRLERCYLSYCIVPNAINVPEIEKYFNRLSDYLFVLARYYNNKGKDDIIWKH